MKRTKILAAALLLCIYGTAQAQDAESSPENKTQITEVYVQPGVYVGQSPTLTLNDFKMLAPGSALLNQDLSGYDMSSYGYDITGSFSYAMAVGITFKDKSGKAAKRNPVLRLGLTYNSVSYNDLSYFKEERFSYDSLTSGMTGEVYYLDSVSMTGLNMSHKYDQLSIDASVLFRTNPAARWHLFGGVGVTAGISLQSKTDIYSYQTSNIEQLENSNYGYGYPGYYSGYYPGYYGNSSQEIYVNDPVFGASGYVPMGLDFRISNKNDFFKNVHLYYEMRPRVSFANVPETGSYVTAGLQQGLGVKITWL